MGIFDSFFNRSAVKNDDDTSALETTLTCDSCGRLVDEDEMEEGQCQDCYNSEYTGTKYCCGMIYEEGEDTCMSCGESL